MNFTATIDIIGVNPYVEVPASVLKELQEKSQKLKGPIPVKGTLQGKPYLQTVVKFSSKWRLYINGIMIKASGCKVGDTVKITIEYDPKPRIVEMPPLFQKALDENKVAKEAFEKLPPYKQKEINRYLGFIKSEEVLKKNIEKTIKYLNGEKVQGVLYR